MIDKPKFDVAAMRDKTLARPTWLQVGAGNIFRIFVAGLQQDLLDAGLADTGIIVYEAYDEEIIEKAFKPFDNRTLGVTLRADGSLEKREIASIADAFAGDTARLYGIIAAPSLQMISIIITEKGYAVDPANICASPQAAATTIEQVTAGLLARFNAQAAPLALVTMDNFAENGTQLAQAIRTVAESWEKAGLVSREFIEYLGKQAYPWTMIDKITPRPSPEVAKMLAADGYNATEITETAKHTFVASFVNAESAQYLIIEDNFPNGRPPLERAGAYMTDRETVKKTDQMKVCACLNPLHTILAVSGMLLGYPTIWQCMEDARLVKLIKKSAQEALPVVENPGIIDPEDFLNTVLTERFPNPFIPDQPVRIACDTSQKVPVRFGVAMQERMKTGIPTGDLEAAPLFVALWLRYLMGKDDNGNPIEVSPDPRLPEAFKALEGLAFGGIVDLAPMLSDATTFGVSLYDAGLGEKITALFAELASAPGAVGKMLDKLYG
ncbi:MAG: mannitol dehydrogenase family protein [Defluviitaleaceae bacterium]|nr:mannitol dehydrogenase family protein [Defluviitaleaceae bacterium]